MMGEEDVLLRFHVPSPHCRHDDVGNGVLVPSQTALTYILVRRLGL